MLQFLPIVIFIFTLGGAWADLASRIKNEKEKRELLFPIFEEKISGVHKKIDELGHRTREDFKRTREDFKDVKKLLNSLLIEKSHGHKSDN